MSRHFVPGYDRTVPPGQKPFAYPSASRFQSAYKEYFSGADVGMPPTYETH